MSGANLNDAITVDSGMGNVIHGLNGNDVITMNTANNKLFGDAGNDKIVVNASNGAFIIDGGDGSDEITLNADSTTNILGGLGNDKITVTGKNNVMDGGDGDDYLLALGDNNTINSSGGSNTINAKGNNNRINETNNGNNTIGIDGIGNILNLSSGNNTLKIIGQLAGAVGNTITTGSGNNSFDLKGDSNKVTTGNGNNGFQIYGNFSDINSGSGNDYFNIYGNSNDISSSGGGNSYTVAGSDNLVQGGAGKDNFTVTGGSNTLNGGAGDDFFNIRTNATDNVLDGEGGTNRMHNYGVNTTFTNIEDTTPPPIFFTLQVGANSDENSRITIQTGLVIDDLFVKVDTVENASSGIELIDKMLGQISEKISEVGAVLGRLGSVARAQNTQLENLTASVSTIMDADIAEESALFVKNQILQQSASSLLNQVPRFHKELILSLIR